MNELFIIAIIVGGIISLISSLIIIQRLFNNKIALMELRKQYEIDLLKLKKREGRRDKKLAAEINVKPPTSTLEKIQGLDMGKINNILDMVQGRDYDTGEGGGLLDNIGDFVSENDDMIQGLLDGLKTKKGGEDEQQYNFE